jgi:hypothetical protein
MNLKEMYYYLFYKLYKFNEAVDSTFSNKMKAEIMIVALEIWLLFTLFNYGDFLFHEHNKLAFFSFKILFPLSAILAIKWFAFIRDNTWKHYIEEFDNWPKDKNKRGTWIVTGLVIFIIANFIFSHYIRSPSEFRW